jgi:hypothetical protein
MDIFGWYYTLTNNFTDEQIRRYLTVPATMTDECTDGYLRSVFQTLTDTFTDGMKPSVRMSHYHRWDKSVGIFQAGNFFFARNFRL